MIDQLIQLSLSLIGIYLLGVLAARLWPQEQILDSTRIDRALARATEPKTATKSLIASDNKSALALTDKADLTLLHIMGDRVTVSPLQNGSIKGCERDGHILKLTLDNFTNSDATICFSSEHDSAAAETWIIDLNVEDPT